MAACKLKSCSEKRSRKWSDEELKKFVEVLADDYAFDLETLVLKKSSNDQIFQDIKEKLAFDLRLSRAHEGGKVK